jgi:asparaginyl-tRNA synthetase
MASLTTIEHLGEFEGQDVTLRGWLYNLRESGKLLFPIFRDGSGVVQGVMAKNAVSTEMFERVKGLTQESSVIVHGKVRADQRAPGGFELDLAGVEVVQRVADETPYPISLKDHGVEFLMEHRHLWLRSPRQVAILRIRSEIERAMHDFFYQRGFTRTDPPILTPAACEGTSTLFPVKYFDEEAYLTQSGQLYMEAAAMALRKVYSFGPTFRAEKSKTRRHLTEFWMIEPEVAYMDLEGLMVLAENFIAHIVQSVLKNRAPELQVIGRDAAKLEAIKPPFPRLRYDEACYMLNKAYKDGDFTLNPGGDDLGDLTNLLAIEPGDDFGSPHETWLSKQFDKPVMVHRYPADAKAFYMEPDPKDPRYALCVDVLAPEGYGEIIGGSQRVSSYELLSSRIDQHKLPRAAFEWYLDLRRYGSVPHSGFGMGIERLVAWVCALDHVRETIPFPRMLNRMYP